MLESFVCRSHARLVVPNIFRHVNKPGRYTRHTCCSTLEQPSSPSVRVCSARPSAVALDPIPRCKRNKFTAPGSIPSISMSPTILSPPSFTSPPHVRFDPMRISRLWSFVGAVAARHAGQTLRFSAQQFVCREGICYT